MIAQDTEDGLRITCQAYKGYGWITQPPADIRGRECNACRGNGTIPSPALLRTRPFPIQKAIEITTPR